MGNLLGLLVCAVASMILGFVWFGPLFGKQWMKVIGATPPKSAEAAKKMQQAMVPTYIIAFLLAGLEAFVLSGLIAPGFQVSALQTSFWIWLGFVVPTVAGGSMWNNDSPQISIQRFLILSGYYLALLSLFSFILSQV